MEEREVWLTRQEAADWLKCNPATVSNIIKEMEELDLDGVWKDPHFVRVNKKAMNEYIFKRRKIKNDRKRGRNNY